MRRIRVIGTGVLLLGCLGACGRKSAEARKDEVPPHVSETVLAKSKIPGASAVGKALNIADSAAARRRMEDSIAREKP